MSNDSQGGSSFSWFLAGLGLGSLLGVLYAPRPGQETRDELVSSALGGTEFVRQRSRDVAQTAGQYVERSKGQVSEYVNRGKEQATQYTSVGKEQANQYVAKGKEVVETGRQKINEVYSQGAHVVAEQKEKIAAAIDAGKQAYTETSVPAGSAPELIPSSEKHT